MVDYVTSSSFLVGQSVLVTFDGLDTGDLEYIINNMYFYFNYRETDLESWMKFDKATQSLSMVCSNTAEGKSIILLEILVRMN